MRKGGEAHIGEFHILTDGLGNLGGDRSFLVHFGPVTDVNLINGKPFFSCFSSASW